MSTKLMQLGIRYGNEMSSGIGHTACTLDNTHYESRGSAGCIKGSGARGADNSLFTHHFYWSVTDAQVKLAKAYANACIGEPYVWGAVPLVHGHGGDCSGFMSGIICAARGEKIGRLFSTGNWLDSYVDLGFHKGLAPAAAPAAVPAFTRTLVYSDPKHVMHGPDVDAWQTQMKARGWAVVVDGQYGPASAKLARAFQQDSSAHGWKLTVDGVVGPKTWAATWSRPVG